MSRKNARPGCTGEESCICPWCLTDDMNTFVFNEFGLDPADYPVILPGGRVVRPESSAAMLAAEADAAAREPVQVDDENLPVLVQDTGVGVWARFTGTNLAGELVTVEAAVVAGPSWLADGQLAVVLDLFDDSRTLVPLRMDAWALCELVDDDDDDVRQVAHSLTPLPGRGADRVWVWRWTPPARAGRAWAWVPALLTDVSAADMRAFEHDPQVRLVGVHHAPIPVTAELTGGAQW